VTPKKSRGTDALKVAAWMSELPVAGWKLKLSSWLSAEMGDAGWPVNAGLRAQVGEMSLPVAGQL
jgi:hypothetical protein